MTHPARGRRLVRLSLLAAAWAFAYALYRAYYAFGGTLGMIGVPASQEQWRAINLAAAVLIAGAAVLALVAIPLWRLTWPRRVLLGVALLIAVACIGHAVINDILRVLSLAGRYEVYYPPQVWVSIDRRAADLQDLFFNETWFLGLGLLWAAMAWMVLGPTRAGRWWVGSAVAAVAVATAAGLLSAFGVIARVIIG